MALSNGFMSGIIGAIAAVFYIAAPFLQEEKKALSCRIISEVLFALMFLYIGHLGGISYYLFLAVSALFEKQIEHNKIFSLVYGFIACAVTLFLNNSGMPGIFLAISLVLIFLHLDEKTMLTLTSYIDVLTSLILLAYCIHCGAWVGAVFAFFLLASAIAGMVSAVKLTRAGGLKAAAAEERAYQKQQEQQKSKKKKK